MNKIKIAAGVVILVLLGLAAEMYLFSKKAPNPDDQIQKEINFKHSGNIARNNPGMKRDVWYLVYETPGSPALNRELNLASSQGLENGTRAYVEGFEQGGVVQVTKIFREVSLFYYNPDKDKDASGNILCSRQGLVEVNRQISLTSAPIADTIKLLLQGNLTESERRSGITTEYPLPGLELKSADLKNGTLTLQFSDPLNKTNGGSCRVGILWSQIEATAKQFSGVSAVRFQPLDALFQP